MVNSIKSLLEIDENTARKFTVVHILENCVHTWSTWYVTVYIVTPFSPCQTPFWNMSLVVTTERWTAQNLQKLCADRDPVPTFVPENEVETLYLGIGIVPRF